MLLRSAQKQFQVNLKQEIKIGSPSLKEVSEDNLLQVLEVPWKLSIADAIEGGDRLA